MLRNNKGFTLIELLIVIVIIGILAVAVLSVLNPIDQINKAQDQARKSTAAAIISALERFYVSNERYPWSTPGLGTVPVAEGTTSAYFIQASGTNEAWLGTATDDSTVKSLIGASELKPDVAKRSELAELKIYTYSSGNLVRICFRPESTTLISEATYIDGMTPTTDGVCPADVTCQYCLPE